MKIESLTPSFIQATDFTVLEVKGTEAAAFLHRLSTNHITNLDVLDSCLTTFLDQKGRLVALAYVKRFADHFKVIVPYKSLQPLALWLDTFLFTEDATITDVTAEVSIAIGIGTSTQSFRGPDFRFKHTSLQSHFLMLPLGSITLLDYRRLTGDEFEALRIAGRVPLSSREINGNFNPLQLGIGSAIHWAKGCYIGQEVVSRLESKEKAVPTLYGGRVAKSDLAKIKPGESVHTDHGPAGVLTSVAPMDLGDEANVLVVLKRPQRISTAFTDLSKVRIDILPEAE